MSAESIRERARRATQVEPPPIVIDNDDDDAADQQSEAPPAPAAAPPAAPQPNRRTSTAPKTAPPANAPPAPAPSPPPAPIAKRRKRNISIILQNQRALLELDLIERKLSDMRGDGNLKGAIGPTRILAMGLRLLTALDDAELEQLAQTYSDEMADE